MRTRIMNQLQAVAMNEGYRWKKKLINEESGAGYRYQSDQIPFLVPRRMGLKHPTE
jgi:hypothetical protein